MMSLTEKTAYLKGLYDGMGLDSETSKEARMLGAIVDVLQELAGHVDENEESLAALADELDDLEDSLLPDDEDESMEDEYDDMHDEFGLEGEDDIEPLELPMELPCPNCGEALTVNANDLEEGMVICPECGQKFQIELDLEPKDEEEDMPF